MSSGEYSVIKPSMSLAELDPTDSIWSGLDSYWLLSENGGISGYDLSPKVRVLTLTTAGWGGLPLLNKGVILDGTRYGTTPTAQGSATSTPPPAFTVAIRFYTGSIAASTLGVCSIGNTNVDANPTYLLQRSGATLQSILGGIAYRTLTTALVANQLCTAVSVWDGTNEIHYYNGVQSYSGVVTGWGGGFPTNDGTYYIGTGYNGALVGGVEWSGVWGRVLTPIEVWRLSTIPYSGLLSSQKRRKIRRVTTSAINNDKGRFIMVF